MSDLFGDSAPAAPKQRIELKLQPPRVDPDLEIPPAFGTPAWDRCRCGGWASLYFPLVGGLRRCQRCARAEGRMSEDRR